MSRHFGVTARPRLGDGRSVPESRFRNNRKSTSHFLAFFLPRFGPGFFHVSFIYNYRAIFLQIKLLCSSDQKIVYNQEFGFFGIFLCVFRVALVRKKLNHRRMSGHCDLYIEKNEMTRNLEKTCVSGCDDVLNGASHGFRSFSSKNRAAVLSCFSQVDFLKKSRNYLQFGKEKNGENMNWPRNSPFRFLTRSLLFRQLSHDETTSK